VAEGGRALLLGISRQFIGEDWLGARGFQYAGSIGPWPVTQQVLEVVARLGQVLAERFELIGLFGVDFICQGEQVWTVEVNPRYTASVEIIERATGTLALAAHAQACTASPVTNIGLVREPLRKFHGKAILFAKADVMISERFAAAALTEACRNPWPALADISPPGTLVERGRPLLTVFAEGQSLEEVYGRLQNTVAQVEQEVYPTEVKR
jgi:predicted ATP-grasp superfamily ATP-dependent carboligase